MRNDHFDQLQKLFHSSSTMDASWLRCDSNGIYFVTFNNTVLPVMVQC